MAESEPSGEIARNELRASHDDRDRVVELLRVSAGDGRLTAEELDQRLELALTARTYGELAKLVTDLPATGSVASPPATAAKPKDVARIDCRSGHVRRVDRWIVPQRMEVKVTSGHVELDLTQAVITQPVLRLDIECAAVTSGLRPSPGSWWTPMTWRSAAGTSRCAPPGAATGPSCCESRSPGRSAAATSWRGRHAGRSGSG